MLEARYKVAFKLYLEEEEPAGQLARKVRERVQAIDSGRVEHESYFNPDFWYLSNRRAPQGLFERGVQFSFLFKATQSQLGELNQWLNELAVQHPGWIEYKWSAEDADAARKRRAAERTECPDDDSFM